MNVKIPASMEISIPGNVRSSRPVTHTESGHLGKFALKTAGADHSVGSGHVKVAEYPSRENLAKIALVGLGPNFEIV